MQPAKEQSPLTLVGVEFASALRLFPFAPFRRLLSSPAPSSRWTKLPSSTLALVASSQPPANSNLGSRAQGSRSSAK